MRQNNAPTIDKLIQAMQAGTVPVDADVLQEIKDLREQKARMEKEDALLEATEQKFAFKQDYAKALGNWASGIQKKFIDGLILHRQKDPHSKIHQLKVGRTKFDGRGIVRALRCFAMQFTSGRDGQSFYRLSCTS